MFIELEDAKAIEFPPARLEMLHSDQSKYCLIHRRHGHNIDGCWTFRDIVYNMADADVFEWDVLVKRAKQRE